jgi:hypothetical protein
MAIRVLGCHTSAGGCLLTFVPDDGDASLFLARACRVFGWSMGRPGGADGGGARTAFVRGATSAGFRSEFDGMPELDFSDCEGDAGTCRDRPEGEGTVIIDP